MTIDRIDEISRAKKAWIEAERHREFQEWRRTGVIPERISNQWMKKKLKQKRAEPKKNESYTSSDYFYGSYSSYIPSPAPEQKDDSVEDKSFDYSTRIYTGNGVSIDPSEHHVEYESPGVPKIIYTGHGTYRKDENGNWHWS